MVPNFSALSGSGLAAFGGVSAGSSAGLCAALNASDWICALDCESCCDSASAAASVLPDADSAARPESEGDSLTKWNAQSPRTISANNKNLRRFIAVLFADESCAYSVRPRVLQGMAHAEKRLNTPRISPCGEHVSAACLRRG